MLFTAICFALLYTENGEKESLDKVVKTEEAAKEPASRMPSSVRRHANTSDKKQYAKKKLCTYCMKRIKGRITRHILIFHKGEADLLKTKEAIESSKEHIEQQIEFVESSFEGNKTSNVSAASKYTTSYLKGTSQNVNMIASAQFFSDTDEYDVSDSSEKIIDGLLRTMESDDLKLFIRQDRLLLKYAVTRTQFLARYANQKPDYMHQISQAVRTLARLVMACRKRAPGIFLNDLLRPENFELVVEITKSLAVADKEPAASFGRYVGIILAHVISLKTETALHANDDEANKAAELKKVFEDEWKCRMDAFEAGMMNTNRRGNVPVVPVTDDIIKLRNYLVRSMRAAARKLKNFRYATDWVWLAKLTLTRLTLFNKCKWDRVKDLKVRDYFERRKWMDNPADDSQVAITAAETILAERFDVCCLKLDQIVHYFEMFIVTNRLFKMTLGQQYLKRRLEVIH